MSLSNSYSRLDRALHHFAFFSPFIQKTLAELENDLFRKEIKAAESRNELFITGLPRAGTTLMLELLYETGEFHTYRYRDMPFILAPLLWNRISSSFQRTSEKQERAHGDKVEISVDSPEAFDEVIWLTYLRDKFVREDRLSTVSARDIGSEFRDAMRKSVRKVLALPNGDGSPSTNARYLSKNNANISRIDALLDMFPTATVLVVFRDPAAQARSLAGQHKRFLEEHGNDKFSRSYMKWIGHFEFGENFKPIDFGGWLDDGRHAGEIDETFWRDYWGTAYAYALQHDSERVLFVDYDQLVNNAEQTLQRIATAVHLRKADRLVRLADRVRRPTTTRVPAAIQDHVQEVHEHLKSAAI